MVFRFKEARNSRSQSVAGKTYELKYIAAGSSSDLFVRSYAVGATPALINTPNGTLYRQDVRLEPTASHIFRITVPYAEKKNETGSLNWRFSTTGGTVRVRASKQTVKRYPENAFDFKNLIGVNGKDVEGTEIVVPAMKISVNYKHPLGVITLPYARHLFNITGTTNQTAMLGFPRGEVLFFGSDGADGTDAEATVSYEFVISQNAKLTIGDITNIEKLGHQYLWLTWESNVAGDAVGQKPKAIYIERVYNEIDMAVALGFGG